MVYTSSKKADEKISKDVEIIKKIILKRFAGRIKAIVMFGGFGHGGGSFKIVDKEVLPLNDYDLYLVSDKMLDGDELEKVGEECSRALGRAGIEFVENFDKDYDEVDFFHVDLHCAVYKKLKELYPMQRTFDLKTSIVVWGDKSVLKQIPDVDIPVSDAIRLLFNKLDHFEISRENSKIIQSIYAVKGFTDLCSALLIFNKKYTSRYQDRVGIFKELDVPGELKKHVEKATHAKLNKGYEIPDVDDFYQESKKWVEWTLKKILKEHLKIKSDDWKEICKVMYRKLPFIYFNDYLGSKYLFFGQYYLNLRFFLSGLKKEEFFIKSLLGWRDAGLKIGISLMLYSFGEKKEAEKYLSKLTGKTAPLRERILKLYSIYYLQKLI